MSLPTTNYLAQVDEILEYLETNKLSENDMLFLETEQETINALGDTTTTLVTIVSHPLQVHGILALQQEGTD